VPDGISSGNVNLMLLALDLSIAAKDTCVSLTASLIIFPKNGIITSQISSTCFSEIRLKRRRRLSVSVSSGMASANTWVIGKVLINCSIVEGKRTAFLNSSRFRTPSLFKSAVRKTMLTSSSFMRTPSSSKAEVNC
jgi:hypothetical protein